MKNLLFVCHGNICRSPMAEFIMKHLVRAAGREKEFHIESAAVSDEERGNPIYPAAKACLKAHGIAFDDSKRSRKVTPGDYDRFDGIICMDSSNLRLIRHIIPDDPERKISLLMSHAGSLRDVADPWYTRDFEKAFRDIHAGCEAIAGSSAD